jgi:hypothetical protein
MCEAAIAAAVCGVCEVEPALVPHRLPAVCAGIAWFPLCEQLLAELAVCPAVAALGWRAALGVAAGVGCGLVRRAA